MYMKRLVHFAVWVCLGVCAFGFSDEDKFIQEPVSIRWVKGQYDGPRSFLKLSARLNVPDGWHVYADTMEQEYYVPTRFAFPDSLSLALVKKKYPKPEVKRILGEKLAVFEGEVAFDNYFFTDGVIPGEVLLQYQSCTDKICLPPVFTKVSLQAAKNGEIQVRY